MCWGRVLGQETLRRVDGKDMGGTLRVSRGESISS